MMAMAAEHTGLILGEGGGLSGVIESVGQKFAFLAEPANIAFGTIGAVVLGGVAALIQYNNEQKEIEIGLSGIAAASGVTAHEIEAMADSVSMFGSLSHGTAVTVALDFAKVADNGEQIKLATNDAAQMVGKLGMSATEAQKALAGIFTDPIKGYEDLTKVIGGFNITTDAEITRLVSVGDHSQAVTVALGGVDARMIGMADHTSKWTQAVDTASTVWSGFGKLLDASLTMLSASDATATHMGSSFLDLSTKAKTAQISFTGFTDAENKSFEEGKSLAESINTQAMAVQNIQGKISDLKIKYNDLQNGMISNGTATQAEIQLLGTYGQAIASLENKLDTLRNADGSLVTAQQRMATTTRDSIAALNAHTDAARIAAVGQQAFDQALQQTGDKAIANAAKINAESQATSTLANSWQDSSNKTLLSLDLQAAKLQSQIDLIGKNTAAQQQGAMVVQQYDSFATTMFQHGITNLGAIHTLWGDVNVDVHGLSDTTQSYNQFQQDMFKAGITDVNVIKALWDTWTGSINSSSDAVKALITQLNNALAAAKNLSSVKLGNLGTPVNSADEGQPNTSWTPSSFTPASEGFAAGGAFDIPGPPSKVDNMTVKFPVASGERVTITPAHQVSGSAAGPGGSVSFMPAHGQHGFAGGGQFDVPGAGLSSAGGGADPNGPYAGIQSFAGAGASSTAGANTSGINALAAKAPAGVTGAAQLGPALTTAAPVGSNDSSLSDISDALQLASVMSPSGQVSAAAAPVQATQNNTASGGGGNNFYISVSITANDPTSFSNSSAQIASTLRRAISAATSHTGP
jgi:hypothetical protein